MDRLLQPAEIADYLHVDIKAARRLIRTMPYINISGSTSKPRLLVAESDLAAWVEARKTYAPAKAARRASPAKLRVMDGFEPDGRLKRRKA